MRRRLPGRPRFNPFDRRSTLRHLAAVLGLPFVLLLTACAASKPAVVLPDSLTHCANEPAVPAQDTDVDVANLLLDYREAHADCKGKLGAVVGLVKGPA